MVSKKEASRHSPSICQWCLQSLDFAIGWNKTCQEGLEMGEHNYISKCEIKKFWVLSFVWIDSEKKKNPTATYFFFTREQLKKVACYDLWSSLIYRLEKFSGVDMKEVNDASLYRLGSQAGRQNALRMKSQNIIMWVERLYLRNKHIFLQRNFPDFWGKFGIFPVSLTPLPLVWRGHRCVPFLYQ